MGSHQMDEMNCIILKNFSTTERRRRNYLSLMRYLFYLTIQFWIEMRNAKCERRKRFLFSIMIIMNKSISVVFLAKAILFFIFVCLCVCAPAYRLRGYECDIYPWATARSTTKNQFLIIIYSFTDDSITWIIMLNR